jgi:hypothetical protein
VLIDDEGNLYFIDADVAKVAQEGDYFSEEDYDSVDNELRFHATPRKLVRTIYTLKYQGDAPFVSIKNFADSGLGIDVSSLDPNESFMIRSAYVSADRKNAFLTVYPASAPAEGIEIPFQAERILQQQEDVIEAQNKELEAPVKETEETVDPSHVATISNGAAIPNVSPLADNGEESKTLTTGVSEHDPETYAGDKRWVPKDSDTTKGLHKPQVLEKVSYLREVGAFDYLNNGHLKPGDKVYVLADPAYWQRLMAVTRADGKNNRAEVFQEFPLLFAVEVSNATETTREVGGKHYQIIGTFPWKQSAKLSRVDPAFKKRATSTITKESKDRSPFIVNRPGTETPITTSVINVSRGILQLSAKDEQRPLHSSLHNADQEIVLAVQLKGEFVSNKQGITILNAGGLMDKTNNRGLPYLLIPSGEASKKEYLPVALVPKNFSDKTFNINDESTFMAGLKQALWKLATVNVPSTTAGKIQQTSAEIDAAFRQLREYVYLGARGVNVHARITSKADNPGHIEAISLEFINDSDIDGQSRPVEAREKRLVRLATVDGAMNYIRRDPNDIYWDIMKVFVDFKVPVSVDARRLNDDARSQEYIQDLLNADVLQSNLLDDRVKSVYATMKGLTDDYSASAAEEVSIPAPVNPVSENVVDRPREGRGIKSRKRVGRYINAEIKGEKKGEGEINCKLA